MKTTRVPPRAKALNELLSKARREAIILETDKGEQFVLASINAWVGYRLSTAEDITKNRELMKYLKVRRSRGKAITLAQLKGELGLT